MFKGVLYIITYLGFIYFTAYIFAEFHGWAWPILFGIAIVLRLIYIAVLNILEKIETRKREITPCCHGVRGAKYFTGRCKECTDKIEIENAIREAELKAKKDKESAEKQKQYNEFVKNLRLPEYLKSMHPREFELIVIDLYRRMGYKATPTSYVADNGIDGILEKDGKKVVLQCKRVKGYVGEPVLRDLYGAMHDANSDGAIVVTTGKVSDKAKKWATGKPIVIIEMPELRGLIDQHFIEGEVVPVDYSVDMNSIAMCPRCGCSLRTVKTRSGSYLMCPDYPVCSFKRRTPMDRRGSVSQLLII